MSVWQSGAPVFEAFAGWIDPDARTTPVGSRSLFDLASVTKLVTATAFLRLAADRKVDLADSVASVIPEFAESGPRGVDGGQEPLTRELLPVPAERRGWRVDPSTVRFHQLLTHTSGLAPWRAVFGEMGPAPPPPDQPDGVAAADRQQAGLAAICGYPFVARPGEEYHYSDLGYMLLGIAIERLAGQPLELAVATLIHAGLGLDSPIYAPLRASHPRDRLVPTSIDDDWRHRRCWGEVEDENAAALGGVAGHAGLFASVGDVARFGVAWVRQDPRLGTGRFTEQAVTDQTAGLPAARGLGWQLQPADYLAPLSDDAFGHTGFTGTSLAVDPRRDLVIAILSNRVFDGRRHAGIEALRRQAHGVVAEAADALAGRS
jgi:CubicO group peptidase (beta-lactamase class C family)